MEKHGNIVVGANVGIKHIQPQSTNQNHSPCQQPQVMALMAAHQRMPQLCLLLSQLLGFHLIYQVTLLNQEPMTCPYSIWIFNMAEVVRYAPP